MKFFVKFFASNKIVEVNLDRNAQVKDLEQFLIDNEKLERDSFYFTYEAQFFQNHFTLKQHRVHEGTTIFLFFFTQLKDQTQYIELLLGNIKLKINAEQTDTIKELRENIRNRLGVEDNQYEIKEKYGQPKFNMNGKNLKEMGLDFKSSIRIAFIRTDYIKYKYQLEDNSIHSEKILSDQTVFSMQCQISSHLNTTRELIQVFLNGRELLESEYVEDLQLKEQDLIKIVQIPPPQKMNLKIKDQCNHNVLDLKIKESNTLNDLKYKIIQHLYKNKDVEIDELTIIFNDLKLEDSSDKKSLKELSLTNGSEIKIECNSDVQFNLIKLDGSKELINANVMDTVGEVKQKIEALFDISRDQYKLINQGQIIGEDQNPFIGEFQFEQQLTLEMKDPSQDIKEKNNDEEKDL